MASGDGVEKFRAIVAEPGRRSAGRRRLLALPSAPDEDRVLATRSGAIAGLKAEPSAAPRSPSAPAGHDGGCGRSGRQHRRARCRREAACAKGMPFCSCTIAAAAGSTRRASLLAERNRASPMSRGRSSAHPGKINSRGEDDVAPTGDDWSGPCGMPYDARDAMVVRRRGRRRGGPGADRAARRTCRGCSRSSVSW